MRKVSKLLVFVIILSLSGQFLSSCKKTNETPAKPKLSFSESTATVNESDQTLEVELKLDKPAGEAISITYELDGTAVEKVASGGGSYDYEIVGNYLECKIKKGETTGTIELKLYSDFSLENDETIDITISSVDSDNIDITRDDHIKITLTQEDGMIVVLEWPNPTVDSLADMDMILRVGDNTSTWDGILTGSVAESFTGPEIMFIPNVVDYPAYGVSYTYYDGTFHKLEFMATFIDWVNGEPEPEADQDTFQATYTLANKNKWTDVGTTQVVQTFHKTGNAFTTFSDITTPVSGSRVGSSGHLTTTIKKGDRSESINRLIIPFIRKK